MPTNSKLNPFTLPKDGVVQFNFINQESLQKAEFEFAGRRWLKSSWPQCGGEKTRAQTRNSKQAQCQVLRATKQQFATAIGSQAIATAAVLAFALMSVLAFFSPPHCCTTSQPISLSFYGRNKNKISDWNKVAEILEPIDQLVFLTNHRIILFHNKTKL